jgi:hypothetical protein
MINEELRISFLSRFVSGLLQSGVVFISEPDFNSFKHGNIKITSPELVHLWKDIRVGITVEHYHIRREGWHPLYWGLQAFFEADSRPADPFLIPHLDLLVNAFEKNLNSKLLKPINLHLYEPKYGWFAWHCFEFSRACSDLDDPKINSILAENADDPAARCLAECLAYITAWQETVSFFK